MHTWMYIHTSCITPVRHTLPPDLAKVVDRGGPALEVLHTLLPLFAQILSSVNG